LLQVHTALYFSLLILHPIQAMIFLKENTLLKRELSHDDIKPRLLGHWGTCPGLVLIYAHLNRVIRMTGQDMLYVVGPGTWMVFTLLRKPSSESFSRTR
jgi:phosphoketolase